jgi:hypothetical protein
VGAIAQLLMRGPDGRVVARLKERARRFHAAFAGGQLGHRILWVESPLEGLRLP